MSIRLIKYYNTISFNYINEIFDTIYRNIVIASEKDNLESFNELLDFVIYVLKGQSFNKSTNAFSKTATFFILVYPELPLKYKKILIERCFDSYISNISTINDSEGISSRYSEISYLLLLTTFRQILKEDDYELFNFAINRFNNTFFKIDIEKDKERLHFYFITTLLSWTYYLGHRDLVTYNKYDLNYLEHSLEQISYEDNFNFIENFFNLFHKVEFEGFWGVVDWDIEDPPMNVVYYPLTPRIWFPYGLVFVLLKFQHLINVNENLNNYKLDPKYKFIYDSLKNILVNIKDDEYIKIVSNNVSKRGSEGSLEEQFNFGRDKILSLFLLLKKDIELDHYKKIKATPLSKFRISEFRENVGKLWKDNAIILNILKDLDKVKYIPDINKKDAYGFFQKLERMKIAFIDGEEYQHIFGLTNYGLDLARSIDNLFFNNLDANKVVSTDKIEETVVDFIDNVANKKNLIIFASWGLREKIKNITYDSDIPNPLFRKTFMGVPIVNNYYSKLKDFVTIVDFTLINVNIYTSENSSWYDQQLLVEVTESHENDITEDVIKEWSEKDGYEYNADEVSILESTNVNVKVLLKFEFNIPENASYIIINNTESTQ